MLNNSIKRPQRKDEQAYHVRLPKPLISAILAEMVDKYKNYSINITLEDKMDEILALFPDNEREKRQRIDFLMDEWKKEVSKSKVLFREDNILCSGDKYFVSDGFFPNYFSQKNKRVLFIGREPRGISGNDLIERIINTFRNDIKFSPSWRRILYMAYGIKNNGLIKFEEVKEKTANGIAKEMVKDNDYGYAMMNFSKYSNDCEDGGTADVDLINKFIEDSHLDKRNFLKEELEILDPDIIITANLWDKKIIRNEYLEYMFKDIKFVGNEGGVANLSTMELNGKTIRIIDLYHFSRPFVGDQEYYYDPVMKLLFK
jgi:hypothetical protein